MEIPTCHLHTVLVDKKFMFCLHFYSVKSLRSLAKKKKKTIATRYATEGDNHFGGKREVHFVRSLVVGEHSDLD